jgi:sRNA-binding carbon storage regulator CsrA
MLVLHRKIDGVIEIRHNGETLRVVVCQFDARGVRLGFEGPRSFSVVRDDAKSRCLIPPDDEAA